jgi:anti-sigma factor RsiW
MTHEMIQQKLFALYDGPLTEQERKLVEGHLAQCPECRKAIAQWKAVSARLFPAHTFSEAAEDFFVAKVMDRVRSSSMEAGRALWGLTLRWVLPLVGSAALAGWVFFSVLPDSTGLSSSNSLEAAFSSQPVYSASSGNGIMLASYSSSEEIVP